MRSCNCMGGNGSFDCDNCRNTGDCEKTVVCDICGNEVYDDFYEINDSDICEDCLDCYRRSVDAL